MSILPDWANQAKTGHFTQVGKPDMEKNPSSLTVLAEIFWGFGGNIFKWLRLFFNDFGGKQRALEIICQKLLLFNQKHH